MKGCLSPFPLMSLMFGNYVCFGMLNHFGVECTFLRPWIRVCFGLQVPLLTVFTNFCLFVGEGSLHMFQWGAHFCVLRGHEGCLTQTVAGGDVGL